MEKKRFKGLKAGLAGLVLSGCGVLDTPVPMSDSLSGNYPAESSATTVHAYKDGVWVSSTRALGSSDEKYAFISPGGSLLLTYPEPILGDVLLKVRGVGGDTKVDVNPTAVYRGSDFFEYVGQNAGTLEVPQRDSNLLINVQPVIDQMGGDIRVLELYNSGENGLEIDSVED